MKNELTASQLALKEKTSEYIMLLTALDNAEDALEQKSADVLLLSNSLENVQRELERDQAQTIILSTECETLANMALSQRQGLNAEIRHLLSNRQELTRGKSAVELEVDKLTEENVDLKQIVERKELKIKQNIEQIEENNRNISKLEKQLEEVETLLKSNTENLTSTQEENNKFLRQINEIEQLSLGNNNILETKNEEIDTLQGNLQVIETEKELMAEENNALNIEISRVKQENTDLEEKIKITDSEDERLKMEIVNLNATITMSSRDNSDLLENIVNLEESREILQDKLHTIECEHTLMEQRKTENDSSLEILHSQLDTCNQTIFALQSALKKSEFKSENVQKENKKLAVCLEQQQDNEDLTKQLTNIQARNSQLEESIKFLETAIEKEKEQHVDHLRDKDTQVQMLLEELEQRTESIVQAQAITARSKQELECLKQENCNHLQSLTEQNAKLEKELKDNGSEVEALRVSLDEAKQKSDETHVKLGDLEEKCRNLMQDRESLECDIRMYCENVTSLEADVRQKENDVSQRDETITSLKAVICQKENDVTQRDETIKLREEDIAQLKQHIDQLNIHTGDLQQNLEDVSELQKKIKDRDDTITAKDDEILNLEESLKNRTETIAQKDENLATKDEIMKQKQAEDDYLLDKMLDLQQDIKLKNADIESKQEVIEQQAREIEELKNETINKSIMSRESEQMLDNGFSDETLNEADYGDKDNNCGTSLKDDLNMENKLEEFKRELDIVKIEVLWNSHLIFIE